MAKYSLAIGLLISAILVGLAYRRVQQIFAPAALGHYDVNAYWGAGSADSYRENNATILQELRYRPEPIQQLIGQLNQSLVAQPALDGVTFEYGFNNKFLKEFVAYWRDDYLPRWLSREVVFNRMPHFTTNIQGLNIHYIHTRATYEVGKKRIVPILLIHGWPGSVREFYDIIAELASPDNAELDVVFEVVAPSLPGFAWSEAAHRPGLGTGEVAVVLRTLMLRLGYERFYVQGGDWGASLGSAIATIFPQNVIGFHSNMCTVVTPLMFAKHFIASFAPGQFVTEQQRGYHFPALEKLAYTVLESGYFHLQATKPDTIGNALAQNPISMAIWVYEKFSTWTNRDYRKQPDGGWSLMTADYRDAILDNIMIYHLTKSITTSMRLYAEAFTPAKLDLWIEAVPTAVPTGCARFHHDILHLLDWQLQDKYTNLVHSTYHDRGGHFIAMEEPKLLFRDFAKFVRTVQRLEKKAK